MSTLDEIREMSVWDLAGRADCLQPDAFDSPGAALLRSVRDAVLEAWESGTLSDDSVHEIVHEIADGAPGVYTFTRWAQFVDLGAYQEEPEISDEWGKDLTEAAGVALYQIAERLAWSLRADLISAQNEQDDDGE